MMEFINSLSPKLMLFGCMATSMLGMILLLCMTSFVLISAMQHV